MSRVDHKFSRLLRLNSNNANKTLSNIEKGKYVFTTNDNDLSQIRHVALKCAMIPNTEYNINNGNNTFNWYDVTLREIKVPVGQYTTTTLLATLNPLIQAITPSLVITQDTLTEKLIFNASVNFFINPTSIQSSNTLATVLGVLEATGSVMTYNATGLPDLIGLKHVYIASGALSNQTQLLTGTEGEKKYPIFADVPITSAFGTYTVDNTNNENTLDYSDFHSYKNCSKVDITLVDESGRVIEFNGTPWILILRVYG
jgi:hypothetical protein